LEDGFIREDVAVWFLIGWTPIFLKHIGA
jgi:hypothetical protein